MSNKEIQVIMRLKDEVSKRITTIEGKMKQFTRSVNRGFVDLAAKIFVVQNALRVVGSAFSFIEKGAIVEQQAEAFKNLATAVGVSADQIIADMRRMSANTLSTAQIMEKASSAITLGLDPTQLARMMEIARASARAFGKDVGFMFESLTLGIGRQSRMMLDNLGIIVKAEEAYQNYAREIGKTVNQLTDAQKRQAFMNEAMKQGQSIIDKVNVSGKSQFENIQTLKAMWSDFTDDLSKWMNKSKFVKDSINAISVALNFWLDVVKKFDSEISSSSGIEQVSQQIQDVNEEIKDQMNSMGVIGTLLGKRADSEKKLNELFETRAGLFERLNMLREKQKEIDLEQIRIQKEKQQMLEEQEAQENNQYVQKIQAKLAADQEGLDQLRMMEAMYRDEKLNAVLANVQREEERMALFHDTMRKNDMTTWKLALDLKNQFENGLSNMFSGLVRGTTTAKQAFKELGLSMLDILIKFLVQKTINAAVSKSLLTAEVAASTAAAAAIAAAWAPAAAAVSLATLGGNSGPAIKGMVKTHLLSTALSKGVPGLAEGGVINSPGTVLVGERGPELLSLPRAAQVTPLDRVGSNSGSVHNTINIYVPTQNSQMSPEEIADAVGYEIERRLTQGRSFV